MAAPFLAALILLAPVAGPPRAAGRQERTGAPLEPILLAAFQKVNAEIGRAAVLELRTALPGGPYVLIGWGIRADRQFPGDFNDELFGIFVVDPAWRRIERTLEVMPTPRWLDYEIHIENLTVSDVVVVGKGMTYSDGPMRRTYVLTTRAAQHGVAADARRPRLRPPGACGGGILPRAARLNGKPFRWDPPGYFGFVCREGRLRAR